MKEELINPNFERIREKIKIKNRKKINLVKPITEPRYDNVFFEGMDWIDSLSYSDNWEKDMSGSAKNRVIEPCIYRCNLLDAEKGECKLYSIKLDCGNVEDIFDDGYKFTYFKCQECQNKELDAAIQLTIEELQMTYDNFVEEFSYIIEKLQNAKNKLALINKQGKN